MFAFTFSSCFLLLLVLNRIECSDEEVVSVRLNTGVINGKVETSVDNKRVNVFKGIPYAEPPIGDLRFKKPQPLREWPETYDAFEWPNTCHHSQKFTFISTVLYKKNFSEDCLYLNIWSPESALKSDKLLPVVFYIHGGALYVGSSSGMMGDMKIFAVKGDVVTVSINYRLNTLGFLYTGTDDAPGNMGLWDQALALEWVSDNIKYFGGDPKQISIMGLSAGSWSVSLHVLSPISRNLFQNAILQSGAHVNHMIDGEYDNHIHMWLKGANLIGCNPDKVSDKFTDEIIKCLQKADPVELAGIIDSPEMERVSLRFFPLVVVDGKFLPKSPTEMLRSGDFKKDINLLFSTAADEGSMFLSSIWTINPTIVNFNKQVTTYDQAYKALVEIASNLSTRHAINGEEVAKIYFNGVSKTADSGLLKRTVGIAVGDFILGCGPLLFAKEMLRNSQHKSNVYQYYWNKKVKRQAHPNFPQMDWYGPGHGEDDPDTKGTIFLNPNATDSQRKFSENMIKLFSDFAKTGKPSAMQEGVEWTKHFTIDKNIISPFYEISSEVESENKFGLGLKITECQYLWQKYLME